MGPIAVRSSILVVLGITLVVLKTPVVLAADFEVGFDNSVISPDGDGNKDTVTLRYTLPSSGMIKIKIYQVLQRQTADQDREPDFVLVKNLVPEFRARQEAWPQKVEWNGTNDSGQVVQNGDYEVRVTLTPDRGKPLSGTKLALTVEVIPVFTDLRFLPDPYTPGKQRATIQYRLTKRANVLIRIAGPAGVEVFRKIGPNQEPGEYFIDWDGRACRPGRECRQRDTDSFVQTPGEYTVILAAMTRDRKKHKKLTKFRVTPHLALTTISARPRVFDPRDKGGAFATHIQFEVDAPDVDFAVTVQDQSGAEVWKHTFIHDKLSISSFFKTRRIRTRAGTVKHLKEFVWGGVQQLRFSGHYEARRKGNKERGEREFETTSIAFNAPPLENQTLIYGKDGSVDVALLQNLLRVRKEIRSV